MRCRRPLRVLSKAWDAVQVELKGEYAPERVLALHEYTGSTPWWRIATVILLTPVPSLIYICLPETVNLAPVSLGMARNRTFFIRFFLSYYMWCLLQTHMISSRMPLLSLSKVKLVVSAVLVAAASTGVELLYAWRIGFPVPFTIHMMAVPYVSLMFLALAIMWYPHVRRDLGLLWKIADAILICVCHGLVIIGYPLFYCAFMKIKPGIASAAFSLLLPVLKIIGRLLFFYLCRSAAGDRITTTVVFNADLINALFVNFCMQYQPSLMTTAGLMIANAAQVALMIGDIDSIRYRIAKTQKQIVKLSVSNNNPAGRPGPRSAILTVSMLPRAVDIFQRYSFSDAKKATSSTPATAPEQVRPTEPVQASKNKRGCSWAKWSASHSVTPGHATSPSSSKIEARPPDAMAAKTPATSQLEQLERTYASLVRRLMYASEFSILTAFAEVITPIVYCTQFARRRDRYHSLTVAASDQRCTW